MATRKGNSRDYWEDREAQDRQAFGVINGIISREKTVIEREQRIYQAALAELDKELSALEKDVGADAVTQAALQKPMTARELAEWSKRQEERLDKLIAEYGDDEGRKIFGMENAKTGKQDRANRVVRRNETLRKSINAISNGAAARTETNTRAALEREAREGQEAFSAQLPPELRSETRADFNTVDERTVTRIAQTEFKGEDFSDRIWADRDVLVEDLNRSVTLAATNGWSIPRLAKEFEHNVAVNERSAERIARTEINRVSNATELMQYRENKIKYYRFVATEDARTCPICGELHDKVFAVDDAETGKNFPPVHPNCRCRTVISPVDADGNEDTSWLDDMQAEIDALDAEPDEDEAQEDEVPKEDEPCYKADTTSQLKDVYKDAIKFAKDNGYGEFVSKKELIDTIITFDDPDWANGTDVWLSAWVDGRYYNFEEVDVSKWRKLLQKAEAITCDIDGYDYLWLSKDAGFPAVHDVEEAYIWNWQEWYEEDQEERAEKEAEERRKAEEEARRKAEEEDRNKTIQKKLREIDAAITLVKSKYERFERAASFITLD